MAPASSCPTSPGAVCCAASSRAQLPDAVARSESGAFAATIAGPPLGGLLFGVGRAVPFLADAVPYAASAAGKLLIRTDLRRTGESTGRAADGMRWIWGQPFIRARRCARARLAPPAGYAGRAVSSST
jgi:hypothetical protein